MTDLVSKNSDSSKGSVHGSGAGNAQYNPREFMWSATAVSFGALMTVLQAYTEMRQQQAILGNSVTQSIASATLAEGNAQVDAADSQADSTREQGYASMAQALGSGVGVIGSGAGAWQASSASSYVKPMSDLVEAVNNPQTIQPPQVLATNQAPTTDNEMATLQAKLANNQFTADDFLKPDTEGNTGLNKNLNTANPSNKITLQNLLQNAAPVGTDTAQEQFTKMQNGVANARDKALTNYQSQQTFANNIIQTFSSVGSIVGSSGSSVYAGMQASAQQAQGAATMDVTLATSEAQFANGTYGNVQKAVDYANQGVNSLFSFVLGMQQNDMRG